MGSESDGLRWFDFELLQQEHTLTTLCVGRAHTHHTKEERARLEGEFPRFPSERQARREGGGEANKTRRGRETALGQDMPPMKARRR